MGESLKLSIRYLHKGTTTAGKIPAASDLNQREIYVNACDGLAYTKTVGDQIITLNPPGEITYFGTTAYKPSQCATAVYTGISDANGRVVFNVTKDGTASGAAIFSTVFGRFAQAYPIGTDTNTSPYAIVESFTAKTVTVRLIVGVTLLLLSNTTAFAKAGYRVDLLVKGAI